MKQKEKLLLKIDTSNNLRADVSLGEVRIEKKYRNPRDQDVLSLIKKVLKKSKKDFKDITEIKVNVGPGSFTSTRVGVAIANALAWSLKVKVNEKNQVTPIY
ncbi:hypothetical protein COT75_04555 [Candidatus Beckwithbacteria bacterium CG10_big_fil_rev_8_21_14_0_10_34_10]|uniref:Gcp-like domain-containing protein n=1 Tax=Candidatus Beckwithbacteria bacterium CG10_big_fil_rev_8_21_14_0_10_34_10 TaxID=1974495 RepID=A0A2H0WAB0_9BACT|nr:MAG: hypothetical protein COT75_04555 [Candidatus Beckwithbacteria bacterium CG10_big_fil_rev_8_21_14_0_10_34_10]